MTKEEIEKKLKELEERIKQLESNKGDRYLEDAIGKPLAQDWIPNVEG